MVGGINSVLLDGAAVAGSTGTTTKGFRNSGILDTTHSIKWNSGVNVGEVTIETAPKETYDGTWTPYAVVTFDGSVTPAPKVETVRIQGSFGAFRHRITQELDGGTVTSVITGVK